MPIWVLLCLTALAAHADFQGAFVVAEAMAFSDTSLLNRFLAKFLNCVLLKQLTTVTYLLFLSKTEKLLAACMCTSSRCSAGPDW